MTRRYRLTGFAMHVECPDCERCPEVWERRWQWPTLDPWTLFECPLCRSVLTFVDWHPDGWRVMEANP